MASPKIAAFDDYNWNHHLPLVVRRPRIKPAQ
jgi:hypothetical protein